MRRAIAEMLAVLVIVSVSFRAYPQSCSTASTYAPYPDWVESLRNKYKMSRWPELCKLERDSVLTSLVSISEKVNPVLRTGIIAAVYPVTIFRSNYLRSEYQLVYVQSNLSMAGAFIPYTCFLARSSISSKLKPLSEDAMIIDFPTPTSGRPIPDWSTEIDYVEKDSRTDGVVDSSRALAAAMDMISVICQDQPLVFIGSIFDVYEFSNSVASDLLWDQAATEDTIPKLLSAIQIRAVRGNKYLTGNYVSISYDSTLFRPYDNVVTPPEVTVQDTNRFQVTLFTWSPCSGGLFKWHVTIDRRNGVSIRFDLIADGIGFYFTYL
jgi:hypothetical protein